MKTTRCLGIEPAENGWVVIETICREDDSKPVDKAGGYDPSAAFAKGREEDDGDDDEGGCPIHPRHREEKKIHVFTDQKKLLAFVAEATKDFSTSA